MIGNLPAAGINQSSWLDSVMNDDDAPTDTNVDIVVGGDGKVTTQEIDAAMRQWELLRMQGLTNQTYEDYLTTFGVRPTSVETHKPELVRYVRDWTYPANHVDPTNGTPTSALSWKIAERADKDRYFKEPGFLFGVHVCRPKVYLSKQAGSVTSVMSDAFAWLPAILRQGINAGFKKITAGVGPLPANVDDYWIDLKDLLLYGEQFVNFALTETDAGMVAVPTTALQKRYASSTDADAFFASAGPLNQIRQDGVVSLHIAGSVVDTSPSTLPSTGV